MMRCILFFHAISFLFVSHLGAQQLVTLEEAVSIALAKNHNITVFANTARIAENNAIPGNAGLMPRLDLNANGNWSQNSSQVAFADGTETSQDGVVNKSANASIDLSYTLFDGLGNFYTYNQLQELATNADYTTRLNIENTILQVCQAYYDLALATEQQAIVFEALRISKDRLVRVQYQYDYGNATRLDILNAQVDYNADSTTLINASLSLRNASRNLNVLLSDMLPESFAIDTAVYYNQQLSEEYVLEEALDNNAALLVSSSEVDIARYDLQIARSNQFPVINVNAGYGLNRTVAELGFFRSNTSHGLNLGGSLTFNLFNGMVTRTQIENAKIAVESSEALRQQAELTLTRDVRNAYDSYQISLRILDIEKTNLATATLNFERTAEQFSLGSVTSVQFREAQLNMLQAQNNISIAKYNAKLAEIELLRLAGQILKEI